MGQRYEVREMSEEGMGWLVWDSETKPAFCMKPGRALALEMREGDANRLVACLNALEGIPDPAAFVEAARKVVEEGVATPCVDRLRAALGNTGKAVG